MNLTKKIVATMVGLSMVVMMVPGVAQGVTAEELQAQIDALLAQLSTLQAQLAALQGGAPSGVPGVPAACTGITFNRNLKQGMSGSDVKCLQALLNQSADIRVATTGPGSPGNETTYFGPKTRAAVIKFQEKYAADILTPLGLTAGTGLVGSATRAKLSALLRVTPPPTACTTDADCAAGQVCQAGVCVTPPAPTAALTVALDPATPAAGPIYVNAGVQGSSNTVVTKVKLTAGANPVTLSGLKVTKYGTVANGNIDIARVKVYEGAVQLGSRVLVIDNTTFTIVPALTIAANSSRTLDLVVDLQAAAGLTATVSLGIAAAADITATAAGAAVTASGTFPVRGNLMTVTQATFGNITVTTGVAPPTTVPRVGENDRVLANWVISTGPQEDVVLVSMTITENGTAGDGDITDIKLKSGTEELGTTGSFSSRRAVVTMNKTVTRGSSVTVQMTGDITAGVGRTIQPRLVAPDAVVAKGVTSGVYFTGPATDQGPAATAAITGGVLTVTPNVGSPTDDLVNSVVPQTIGIFDVRGAGEDVVIQTADIRFTNSAAFAANYNAALYDKNGALVSNIVAVPSAAGAQNPPDFALGWTVRAGTTEQLYVKAVTNVFAVGNAGQTITVSTVANGLTGIGVQSGAAVAAPAAGFGLPAITYRHTGLLTFTLNTVEGIGPLNQAALTATAENYWTAVTVIATREDINITLQFNDEIVETTPAFVTCSLYERAAAGTLTNLDVQPWIVNAAPCVGDECVLFNNINAGAGVTVTKGAANAKVLVVKCSVAGGATAGNIPRLDITAAANVTATGAVSGIAIPAGNIAVDFATGADTRGQHTIFTPAAGGVLYVKPNAAAPSGNISRSSTATVGIWDLTAKGADIAFDNIAAGTGSSIVFTSFTGGINAGSITFRLIDATNGTVYAARNGLETPSTATTVTFDDADFATGAQLIVPQDTTVSVSLQEDITSTTNYPQYRQLQFGFANAAAIDTRANGAGAAVNNAGGLVDYPASGIQARCPEIRIQ